MNVKWLVDELLTERAYGTGFPSLAEAAKELGFECYQTKYVPFSKEPDPNIPFGQDDCVVTYGTHEFVRQIKRTYATKFGWRPGSYHRIENLSYSAYSPHYGDALLNDDFVLLPYAEVVRRGIAPWGDAIFLKPDAVTKAFTGKVLTARNWDHEISSLNQIERVEPDTICVVASPKVIKGEFRFIVAQGEVVTGSEYRWDNVLDVRTDVHPLCLDMAKEIAKRPWQPDEVYTCDVALTEVNGQDAARVVELNSFSCSGLYACDTRAIIQAVSKAAWDEYGGEP